MKDEEIKKIVREGYSKIAVRESSCCGQSDPAEVFGKKIGYTDEELGAVPCGSNLGLGCGNPAAMASLREGETVIDLGSGAGVDCFLAAKMVGASGKVIGIDMTPEMVEKARQNSLKGDFENVEFRLGEIEDLPVPDSSVDAVISNCVINLSPSKEKVFGEAFRVLRPGGRLMVSDIVLTGELPDPIRNSLEAYVECLSGAISKNEYVDIVRAAGFRNTEVTDETLYPVECLVTDPIVKTLADKIEITPKLIEDVKNSVVSIKLGGSKPN